MGYKIELFSMFVRGGPANTFVDENGDGIVDKYISRGVLGGETVYEGEEAKVKWDATVGADVTVKDYVKKHFGKVISVAENLSRKDDFAPEESPCMFERISQNPMKGVRLFRVADNDYSESIDLIAGGTSVYEPGSIAITEYGRVFGSPTVRVTIDVDSNASEVEPQGHDKIVERMISAWKKMISHCF